MKEQIASFVGVPFLLGGRTKEGADCWGLTRLVLLEVYNKKLPSFPLDYSLDSVALELLIDQMQPLLPLTQINKENIQEGDLVLMRWYSCHSHIGIYVGDDYVLHSDILCKDLSKLDRLSSPRIAARIEGFYRVTE